MRDRTLQALVGPALAMMLAGVIICSARDCRGDEPSGPMEAFLDGDLPKGFDGMQNQPEPTDRHDKTWTRTAILAGFGFGDLYFTGRAFRLNPDAFERNIWGQSVEERFALKGLVLSGFAIGVNLLEKNGHSFWANVVTVAGCMFYTALMVEAWRIGNEGPA